MCDAFKKEDWGDGDTVITEGESGNKMFFLFEGEAKAMKEGLGEVKKYKMGD